MEVLGAAASILAIVQIAGKLTVLGYGYLHEVKDASKNINDLMREVTTLGKVLAVLQKIIDEAGPDSTLVQTLTCPLAECHVELAALEVRLKKHSEKRRWIRSLKWPLQAHENDEVIQRIDRYKTAFSLAMNAENYSVSKSAHSHVQIIDTHVRSVDANIEDLRAYVVAESVAQISRQDTEQISLAKKKRSEVLHWLYPDSFDTKHNEIRSRRQEDTGHWLVQSKEFQDLCNEAAVPHILWGHGIPGAGKTFLSSRIIDHFRGEVEKHNYGVAHIYFDYQQQEQQSPGNVLSSLVKELAMQQVHLPAEVEALFDRLEHHGKRPTLEDLYKVLASLFGLSSRVFLVFDALDECSQKSQRKALLPLLHRMCKSGAYIFVTSRYYPEDIQRSFRDVTRIELSATSGDIKNYLLGKIDESARLNGFIEQHAVATGGNLGERIIAELTECAHGMFLLVHFHIEYLGAQTTVKQLLAALDIINNSSSTGEHPLDPTYDRVMATIRQQPIPCQELAMKVLSWLVLSRRVLTVDELRTAVSLAPDRCMLDELDIPHRATLVEVCAGLVIIDEINDVIRLSHLTVNEYLLRTVLNTRTGHGELATACISYISFDKFGEGICQSGEEMNARLESDSFFEYIARHMGTHMKLADTAVARHLIHQFVERPRSTCSWVQAKTFLIHDRALDDSMMIRAFQTPLPLLHLASVIGHRSMILEILTAGVDLSIRTFGQRTVLHWAVLSGDVEITKLLIDHGADPLSTDSYGRTIFYEAARAGNEAVVKYLIETGVNTGVVTKALRTPLHAAANMGHPAVVRLLLEHKAEHSVQDMHGDTALINAAAAGHEMVVQLLLENGANVSIQNNDGRNAFHFAAGLGYEPIIQLLLEAGADSSIQDNDGYTAFLFAARYGQEAVVRHLLPGEGNVVAKANCGTTALHLAAELGHISIVRVLLQEPYANTLVADSMGRTPLFLAVTSGHTAIVQHLLECGADPSISDNTGRTAMNVALKSKQHAIVDMLSSFTRQSEA